MKMVLVYENFVEWSSRVVSRLVWVRRWYCPEYFIFPVTSADQSKYGDEGDLHNANDNRFAK